MRDLRRRAEDMIARSRQSYWICLCCLSKGIHHYLPIDERCKSCGRKGTLIECKTKTPALDDFLTRLRGKLLKTKGHTRCPCGCWFHPEKGRLLCDSCGGSNADVATRKENATMAKKPAMKTEKKTEKKPGKILVFGKEVPRGKTTGMRVQECWTMLFAKNEQASKPKKMTDAEIADFMLKEFPGMKSKLFNEIRQGKLYRVQGVRSRYNRGGMTDGEIPETISHRYNEDGEYDDPKFSGKKGVVLEDLDQDCIRPAAESHKPATAKKAKKAKKVVKLKK